MVVEIRTLPSGGECNCFTRFIHHVPQADRVILFTDGPGILPLMIVLEVLATRSQRTTKRFRAAISEETGQEAK